MKIATITPTRGDRREFIAQCRRMIHRQTLPPDEVIFVNFQGKPDVKDITLRYKMGIEEARKRGCDVAFFIEDDDWYHHQYIEWMMRMWEANGQPDLFGVEETYYYHLKIQNLWHSNHPGRASAFSTMVNLKYTDMNWPEDSDPFTDMWIWREWRCKKACIKYDREKVYAIGVKHGMGLTGGSGHRNNLRWTMLKAQTWFNSKINQIDAQFYNKIRNLI